MFGVWVFVQQRTDEPFYLMVPNSDDKLIPNVVDAEPLEAIIIEDDGIHLEKGEGYSAQHAWVLSQGHWTSSLLESARCSIWPEMMSYHLV